MARKYPSELNTRTIRINVADYVALMKLSHELDVTVADVFHLATSRQLPEEPITSEVSGVVRITRKPPPISRSQIPTEMGTIVPPQVTSNGKSHINVKRVRGVR